MPTIDRYYFRACLQGAQRRDADVAALLHDAGVAPASLEQPGWRGSVEAMSALVRGIWQELDDEFMGYTETPMKRGAFAFACELALEAETVGKGLERAARFYNLAGSDIRTETEETEEGLAVTVHFARPELDPDNYFSEFWMIIWHRLACWLASETIPLVSASFDYARPKTYFEEFKYLFPCPRRFDMPSRRIVIDPHVLHAPVQRTHSELQDMLAAAPLDIMTIPASDHSLQRAVRQLLVRHLELDTTAIAHRLNLSPDNLRRKLRAEGMSLSKIRENVRRDKAILWLATTNLSVESIAAELGYTEPRSFTRAFRHWTNECPSAFRKR